MDDIIKTSIISLEKAVYLMFHSTQKVILTINTNTKATNEKVIADLQPDANKIIHISPLQDSKTILVLFNEWLEKIPTLNYH